MTMSLVPGSRDGQGPDGPDGPELQRIARAIGELKAEARPAAGWQARVLASVRAEEAARVEAAATAEVRDPSANAWRWARHASLCAAAAMLLIWAPWQRAPERQLVVELDAMSVVTRGEDRGLERARAGSSVKVAAMSAAGHRALWVFRERDQLVLACPGAPSCASDEGSLRAALEVALVGEYVVVALWSEAPIPPPSSGRDESLAAARRAGATVQSQSFRVW